MQVRAARVYAPTADQDRARVLVDRLWPRGLSKRRAHLTEWCQDIAPSAQLRSWYGHDPDRFSEFRRRYLCELSEPAPAAALQHLCVLARRGPLTLLTATKNLEISAARVLAEQLSDHLAAGPRAD